MKCKYCGQMLVSGKDYCVGCGVKDPVMVLSQEVETLERGRIHRTSRNIKKARTSLILLSITELLLVLLPLLFALSNLLCGENGICNFLWPNHDSTLAILFSVCLYSLIPIAILLLVLIVKQICSLRSDKKERSQMQISDTSNCDAAALTKQVEELERDRAQRMACTIKNTKKHLTLLGIVGILLVIPVIFCIWIWIYRSGWSDGFFAYVAEQGCNKDTFIDSLLNLVYVLAPFIFLMLVSARLQIRSLRGYQDECEQLGLKRNGEYIEKEEN